MPRKRFELIVIGVLIMGIIGYAGASIVHSATRADRALALVEMSNPHSELAAGAADEPG